MPDLYILDVNKGNSAVLIDTLGNTIIDAGKGRYLLEFLIEKEIEVIDSILLSHADEDHIAGVLRLLEYKEIEIKKVFVNSDVRKKTKIFISLMYALDDNDKYEDNESILVPELTSNLTGRLNKGDVHIEVIAPQPAFALTGMNCNDKQATSNSISAVIRLIYKDNPIVLLMGDIDEIGLENILKKDTDIQVQVLVFPHHGGHAGNNLKKFTEQICQSVLPENIIFSIGNNTDKFPRQEVIETISSTLQNTNMYTTNNSDIFQAHITQFSNHKNNVGHIHLDFKQTPLQLKFM